MLSNDLKQILLLHPVRTDYNLQKFRRQMSVKTDTSDSIEESIDQINSNPVSGSGGDESRWVQNIRSNNVWDGIPFSVQRIFKSKWKRRVVEAYIKFRLVFEGKGKDPIEVFTGVQKSLSTLKYNEKKEEEVKNILKTLETSLQRRVKTDINYEKNKVEIEKKLLDTEFNRYQTEESLIEFIKGCKKGLCLTEIESFQKIIPADVVLKINKADSLKVFDNFYILHYDPKSAKNIYYTEKVKPQDPIVFGVISGCTKMFFIADWIDEYCNLTYKDILKEGTDFKLNINYEVV